MAMRPLRALRGGAASVQETNMDWSELASLRGPDSEIPTDVMFRILDSEGQTVGEVVAHKFVLGTHSLAFRRAFFGSGKDFKENNGVIDIKETSKEAFESMIDFMYEKDIQIQNSWGFQMKSLEELYGILNIAKRYLVEKLISKVSDCIKGFRLSLGSLVEVAAIAEEFKQFPEESHQLLERCIDELANVVKFIPEFVATNMESGNHGTILRLVAAVNTRLCRNCKLRKEKCKHMAPVDSIESLMYGTKLVVGQDILFNIFDEFLGPDNGMTDMTGVSQIFMVQGVKENGVLDIYHQYMGGSFSPWNKYPIRFYCHPVPHYDH